MNVTKSKLLVTAIAMSFAATAGVVTAHETAAEHTHDASATKMEKTMSHDAMMNKEDAMKHDNIVRHDMAMKAAAADNKAVMEKDSMKSGSMDTKAVGTSMAAGAAASGESTVGTAAASGEVMDQTKDTGDAMTMDASINKDGMEAKQDTMSAKTDAREAMLEEKADMKKERVDAMDSSQPGTDSWITTKVKSQLAATAGMETLKITVDTVDGTVFLTGVVDNADTAAKASAAAKTIEGVRKVDASGLKSM